MHAITLVIIYNYVLFGFRSNIIFIILYDLQYSDLCLCLPNPRSTYTVVYQTVYC